MIITRSIAKQQLGRPLRMKTSGRLSWEITTAPDLVKLLPAAGPGTVWVVEGTTDHGFIEIKLRHEEDVEFLDTPWEDTAALEAEIRRLLE